MKKGFTLIELLIVMVIVGVLVAVALPQYKRSLERSRALQGLATVRALAEQANARYVIDGKYPSSIGAIYTSDNLDLSASFNTPTLPTASNNQIGILLSRDSSSGWNYSLTASCINGELTKIACMDAAGAAGTCEQLGMPSMTNLLTLQ